MKYLFLIITLAVIAGVLSIAVFTKFRLDDEQYDRLKWIVIRWQYLVAFVALIVKLFSVSYGVETVLLVAGVGVMLAGLLGVANKNYTTQKVVSILNQDLLKDMLGFDADLHLIGEIEADRESEEDKEEIEESEE